MSAIRRLIHCSVAVAMLFCGSAGAATGDLDPSFGSSGRVFVDFSPASGTPGSSAGAATAVDATGRIWAAAVVVGSTASGLGLARMTRNGQLDPTFGVSGLKFLPNDNGISSWVALRIDGAGHVYVAYSEGSGDFVVWRVCRLAENGGFDSTFFGGCAGAAPAPFAVAHDLQISPTSDHSPWIIGSVRDASTNNLAPAIAKFDLGFDLVRTATFPSPLSQVDALAGVIDFSGNLYFTGSYTEATNLDIAIGYVGEAGSELSYQLLQIVPFDVGGSLADVGSCIVLTADDELLIGATVESGINGVYWATLRTTIAGLGLDSSYGSGGRTDHLIANPIYGSAPGNYSINACKQGTDGALTMVGNYYFTDPNANVGTQALAMFRMLADGSGPDQSFGGPDANPGIFYPIAYPGTVLDYLRPALDPLPRSDVATSIDANLPNTGSMIVGGSSKRTDGTSNADLFVMRVLGDDIFNAGFQ